MAPDRIIRMQFTVNRGEKGKIEVKVDIPRADFSKAYDLILSQLSKDSKISGFRPGMAPVSVVEQHVGLNKILNETAGFLVSKHLGEILKKEDLTPIDSPRIAVDSLVKDSPFSFTASFTQKPKVKLGDWKKVKVKKLKPKDVTEDDINQSIKNIYDAYQKQKEGKEDGEGLEGEEGKGKFIYDAQGNKVFFEDKEKYSNGVKPSEDKPDDEFAKKVGARDVAHLKEIVKKDLESLVNNQVEVKLEEELFEKLGEIGKVEVPEVLVEDELNRILVRLNSQLEQEGKKLDEYLKDQKTTVEELKNQWREQAEKNVKTTLLLDEIGTNEKVTVAKEEVENAMKNITSGSLTDEQKENLERYVVVSIFQAKTLDLVKKSVVDNQPQTKLQA